MYVYLELIHDVPTQHCKAIILQWKKKKLILKKRIRLNTRDVDLTPGQGTQPVSRSYWAHTPQLESLLRNNVAQCN